MHGYMEKIFGWDVGVVGLFLNVIQAHDIKTPAQLKDTLIKAERTEQLKDTLIKAERTELLRDIDRCYDSGVAARIKRNLREAF